MTDTLSRHTSTHLRTSPVHRLYMYIPRPLATYIWPHSQYLMRQCDRAGGWGEKSAAKVQACAVYRCRYRCKINDLMREETGTSILFILHRPSGSPDPFLSSGPYPAPTSARSFPLALLRPPSTSPKLPTASDPASEIASDVHPLLGCDLIVGY